MKESKAYQIAILAVMEYGNVCEEAKLDVLRMLFEKEKVALYVESHEEKETENG
jgi:hypothetical protein